MVFANRYLNLPSLQYFEHSIYDYESHDNLTSHQYDYGNGDFGERVEESLYNAPEGNLETYRDENWNTLKYI